MIQLHIISKNEGQIKDIAELLINNKLITGATVIDSRSIYKNEEGKMQTVLANLLIGRTRAVLFSVIEKLLKDNYPENTPVVYGMPIINMDFDHIEKLKKVVKEVKN